MALRRYGLAPFWAVPQYTVFVQEQKQLLERIFGRRKLIVLADQADYSEIFGSDIQVVLRIRQP